MGLHLNHIGEKRNSLGDIIGRNKRRGGDTGNKHLTVVEHLQEFIL